MLIVSIGDNLHEISNPVFWESKKSIVKLSSAKNFTQGAKCYGNRAVDKKIFRLIFSLFLR